MVTVLISVDDLDLFCSLKIISPRNYLFIFTTSCRLIITGVSLCIIFEKTKQDLPMKYVSINYDIHTLRPLYRNVTINQSSPLKVKYVFQ